MTLQEIVNNELRTKNLSYEQLAKKIGMNRGLLWKVAHGKSDSTQARHYFNLPPKTVSVEPCRVCGEVHQLKGCNKRRKRKQIRRAVTFKSESDLLVFDSMLAASGMSFTEWVECQISSWVDFQERLMLERIEEDNSIEDRWAMVGGEWVQN